MSLATDPALHPARDALERFLRGESSRPDAQAIVRHLLTGCPQCRQRTRKLWKLGEMKGMDPATDLRTAVARALRGTWKPVIRDLEAAVVPASPGEGGLHGKSED